MLEDNHSIKEIWASDNDEGSSFGELNRAALRVDLLTQVRPRLKVPLTSQMEYNEPVRIDVLIDHPTISVNVPSDVENLAPHVGDKDSDPFNSFVPVVRLHRAKWLSPPTLPSE